MLKALLVLSTVSLLALPLVGCTYYDHDYGRRHGYYDRHYYYDRRPYYYRHDYDYGRRGYYGDRW